MPQIDFDPQNKKTSESDFDRLKLKKDERARIVLMENPTFAWVHTLRAPKIVNGVAVRVIKERRARRGESEGEKYEDFDHDFIGRPLCLGDYGIIADKGVDPKNCPACQRAQEGDQVPPPERRFAMNVIRYGMNRDNKLVSPFSCTCVVWAFTEGIYGKLIDIAEEHGKLVGRDLLLGPCTSEGFQKYEIGAGAQAVWQTNEQIKTTVLATYKENKLVDLERACGRKVERRWMEVDLDSVAARWRIANGTPAPDASAALEFGTLADGLADLLDEPGSTDLGDMLTTSIVDEPIAAKPAGGSVDFSDLFKDDDPAGTPKVGPDDTVKPAPATGDDFTDLLAQL